ncbi:unnamed protein product, partial [Prorocentrum cordatum]
MKFATELRRHRVPEYGDHCLEYELMREALKRGEQEVVKRGEPELIVRSFCQTLSAQVKRVHAFSLGILKAILERARLLGSPELFSETAWMQLVSEVDRFQSFAWYNCEGVRMIIEELGEKFGPSVAKQLGACGLRRSPLVDGTDIDLWLRVPARRCAELSEGGKRPPQLEFWLQEFMVGCSRASAKIAGQRLLEFWTRGYSQKVTLAVRNTFLELSDGGEACRHGPRRAQSLPPRALAGAGDGPRGEGLERRSAGDSPGTAGARAGARGG